jgi:hypothetical protein
VEIFPLFAPFRKFSDQSTGRMQGGFFSNEFAAAVWNHGNVGVSWKCLMVSVTLARVVGLLTLCAERSNKLVCNLQILQKFFHDPDS